MRVIDLFFICLCFHVGSSIQHNTTIGIDLGTTYSCVGWWRDNRCEIISNDQGNRTTPSYVAFTDTERLIGDGAKNQSTQNPENTIYDAKRLIGLNFNDEKVQSDIKHFSYKVKPNLNGKPVICVDYKNEEKEFKPEEISSMILGIDRIEQIQQNFENLNYPIPKELWDNLIKENLVDGRSMIDV